MAYSDEVLADSPIAYWRLEETSGSTLVDETGNGHDGTNNGATLDVSSFTNELGSAASFDGAGDYVVIPHHSDFDLTNAFTLEQWVKLSSLSASGETQRFQSKREAYGCGETDNGKLKFTTYGELDYITTDAYLSAGVWYHVVFVLDANNDVVFYVDGSLQETVAGSNPANTSTTDYHLAESGDDIEYLNGVMDEPAIYSSVLSQSRIQAHYDAAQSSTEEVVLEAHTVLLKHRPLFEGRFSPHVVSLGHLQAVPLQYHVVNLAHLANTFRGDNSEEGQAKALQAKLGYGWGIPNPAGSAQEKIETPRETWPIDRFHEAERLMRQEGVDEETAKGVGEAMRRLGEDIQLDVRENLRKAEWHANVHTHSGSGLPKNSVATVDVYDLVKLPNGNFWTTVGNDGDKVREFDSDWNLTGKEFVNPAADLDRSRGITFDGRYLWLSGSDSSFFYQVDHLDGGKVISKIAIDDSDLDDVALGGLAFDGIDIWVVENQDFIIWQFATDGTEKQELVFSDVYNIRGLAYWNGYFYFTDLASSQVVKMTPNGNLVDFYDTSDVTTSPTGIWISDTGKVLISEADVGVWEFDLPG